MSAMRPHSKREVRRSSRVAISLGRTSEVMTICLWASYNALKMWKNSSCVRSLPARNWMFLAGKERTQEEFFHIFNALYDAHKQIVITSDVLPKEIATLEERLTSRFEWGLIADISRPDYETKVAILKKKAELDKIDVPPEVLEYIAANIGSNIRELEGALMRVLATASLTNEEVTLPFTEETLKDIIPVINKPINIDAIMQSVSSYFHISVADLQAKRRSQDIAMPRQIAMYLSRDLTEASLPYIGEKFGGRDHTTVIYACQKIQQELKNDDTLRALLDSLVKQLKRGV